MKIQTTLLLATLLASHAARASTLTVTTTADAGPGSLRDALASAVDGDTIDATGISGTIVLTNGELRINRSLSIVGPGAGQLAVDGNRRSRVFRVMPSNTVAVADLTITRGLAGGSASGGGIYNDHAVLTVNRCTLSSNSAFSGDGGAILNHGSDGSTSLRLLNSTLTANIAGGGGGISNLRGSVEIVNSTLSGNTTSGNQGGGIFNLNGVLVITGSTLSGNSGFAGGGIFSMGNFATASVWIANSTLSSNRASGSLGGAIFNVGDRGSADLSILNSTVGTSPFSVGIYNLPHFGTASVQIGSTILNNGSVNIVNDDNPNNGGQATVTSLGYNLCRDTGSGLFNATGDLINTDAMLGPLQDNGGPTFTHALLGCSPAIDHGKNFGVFAIDQRGAGFPRTFADPGMVDAPGGDSTDVGAFETQVPIVDTTAPTIACLEDIVTNATFPAGAALMFEPTASDNCSLASVTCTPPSGSTFAVGTTTVNCTATDGVGLMSSCSFVISVKGAAEQISDVMAYVQALPIESGVKNGLLVKLQDGLKGVNTGNKPKACSAMQDFISLCNAQLAKRKLDAYTANFLINEANRIRVVIGC